MELTGSEAAGRRVAFDRTRILPGLVTDPDVLYEVTLQVEPLLAPAVERYMRAHHIPVIFRTGCFYHVRFDRAAEGKFRTSYRAHSLVELERYLQNHAPGLRAEFQSQFPSGVIVTRETWIAREEWQTE